jgi:hypothetical protein
MKNETDQHRMLKELLHKKLEEWLGQSSSHCFEYWNHPTEMIIEAKEVLT